jgi:hypothetical protein
MMVGCLGSWFVAKEVKGWITFNVIDLHTYIVEMDTCDLHLQLNPIHHFDHDIYDHINMLWLLVKTFLQNLLI